MFEPLNALPTDPLLGLITLYREDPNPEKVDLGVGVYRDENGHTPIMAAVQEAQRRHLESEDSKSYLGPAGVPGFGDALSRMVLGEKASAIVEQRVASLQTPGGCGALSIGAMILKRLPNTLTVWLSDPTWANHTPLMETAGLSLATYPYFDKATGGVDFDAMDTQLAKLGPNDVVLLHGCCHNPTGADLTLEQWKIIAERAAKQGFVPFVDLAYQGLGDDLDTDAAGLRYLSEHVDELLISVSCSKNFGLYRERTGALLVQCKTAEKARQLNTHLQDAARCVYSMPPAHGGFLVQTILTDDKLNQQWQSELQAMSARVKSLRSGLLASLEAKGVDQDFGFLTSQKGMFSFLGISPEQVNRLRTEFSIYMAGSSRINVAGLNLKSIDYLADALVKVL